MPCAMLIFRFSHHCIDHFPPLTARTTFFAAFFMLLPSPLDFAGLLAFAELLALTGLLAFVRLLAVALFALAGPCTGV